MYMCSDMMLVCCAEIEIACINNIFPFHVFISGRCMIYCIYIYIYIYIYCVKYEIHNKLPDNIILITKLYYLD